MGNDNDGVSLLLHLPQNSEQFRDLLNRQYCGRLVQNYGFRPIIQDFNNLNGLLLTDGHIANFFLRVDLEAEPFCDLLDLLIPVSAKKHAGILIAHQNIVCCTEYIHQFEMLMYHTDSKALRILRRLNGHLLSVHNNLPFIRLINS